MIGGVNRLVAWANEEENYALFLKYLLTFAPKETPQQEGHVIEYRSNVPQSPLNRIENE